MELFLSTALLTLSDRYASAFLIFKRILYFAFGFELDSFTHTTEAHLPTGDLNPPLSCTSCHFMHPYRWKLLGTSIVVLLFLFPIKNPLWGTTRTKKRLWGRIVPLCKVPRKLAWVSQYQHVWTGMPRPEAIFMWACSPRAPPQPDIFM